MKIAGDLHTHSIASTHAFSTTDELLTSASRRGLKFLAVTDHGPSMPDAPHLWHFNGLNRLPKTVRGVRLLSGAEVNILPEFQLDLPESTLQSLDFVIASIHSPVYPPLTKEEHTKAYIAAAENPFIDCIGHAGQAAFPFDIQAVVSACKANDTVFEINNASFAIRSGSSVICREIALECMRQKVFIAVTSDAHSMYDVGKFSETLRILEEISFPEELIINASLKSFEEFYKIRKNIELFSEEEGDSVYWD